MVVLEILNTLDHMQEASLAWIMLKQLKIFYANKHKPQILQIFVNPVGCQYIEKSGFLFAVLLN